jgi:hypothetical protein
VIPAQARKPAPVSSARSVFGTRHPGRNSPLVRKSLPAVRCASLSTCCPARRGNLSTAAAASPLHPFHPAARSTIGGRSSPEPAKLTLPPATLSRLGARTIAFCYSLGGDALEQRSRFPRETLRVASSNLGNSISLLRHHYYVKQNAFGHEERPARSTAMDPREQDGYSTRMVELCQVSLSAVDCCDGRVPGLPSRSE